MIPCVPQWIFWYLMLPSDWNKALVFLAQGPRVEWNLLTLECEKDGGYQWADPLFDKAKISNQHFFVAYKIKSDNIPTVKFSTHSSQAKDLTFEFVFTWFVIRNTKDLSHQILTSKLMEQVGYYWYTQKKWSASDILYLLAKSENVLSQRITIITVHWVLLFQWFLWQLATGKLLGN